MKVAINGFGRIGKQFLLAALEQKVKWEFVINHTADLDFIVYSLKYDSVQPSPIDNISHDGKNLIIKKPGLFGTKKIKVFNELDPTKLPWAAEKVDLVVDCTGMFTHAEEAKKHLEAGAKRVLISAPAKGHDATIVLGVNEKTLKKEHVIISAGSCTTNCVAPVIKVLNDALGIKSAFFITTHAYTATQRLIDGVDKKDLRRGRAAAIDIVPGTSGASQSVIECIPELKGKLGGYALRVPVVNGSITSVIAQVTNQVSVEEINALFKKKSKEMAGVLDYTEDPIVSADIIHNPNSSIFDSTLTGVNGEQVSVASWYDNEWGYSCRLVDVARLIEKLK
jgi:glyceraldehyde 3-phosphate dehydrogenase